MCIIERQLVSHFSLSEGYNRNPVASTATPTAVGDQQVGIRGWLVSTMAIFLKKVD
jgi:hypothetical protein